MNELLIGVGLGAGLVLSSLIIGYEYGSRRFGLVDKVHRSLFGTAEVKD